MYIYVLPTYIVLNNIKKQVRRTIEQLKYSYFYNQREI